MFDALIGGSLVAAPLEKVSASGKPYVSAKVRVPLAEGEALFVLATAFSGEACRALLAHASGDSVALAGPVKVGVWQPEQGAPRANVSMVVHAVLSAYAVKRRREAIQRAAVQGDDKGTRRARPPAMADDTLDF